LRTSSARIHVNEQVSRKPRASIDLPVPGNPATNTMHGRSRGSASSTSASRARAAAFSRAAACAGELSSGSPAAIAATLARTVAR
jgi:hypothetical protein